MFSLCSNMKDVSRDTLILLVIIPALTDPDFLSRLFSPNLRIGLVFRQFFKGAVAVHVRHELERKFCKLPKQFVFSESMYILIHRNPR